MTHDGFRIIDFHTHIGEVASFAGSLKGWVTASLRDLLSYMDERGIDKAVLLPLPGRVEKFSWLAGTPAVIKAARVAKERVIPFCAVDPARENAGDLLRKYAELGCAGMGEHKVRLRIDDKRSVRLYRLCGKLGLPVLVHMDNTFNPDIHGLCRVAEECPDTVFIAHGPGWWRHMTAEPPDEAYPTGKIVKEGLVQGILENFDNVYADISATSGLNALERDTAYARRFLERFRRKILFGTDFPCIARPGNQYGSNGEHLDLLLSLGLPQGVLEDVLWRNAARILGL